MYYTNGTEVVAGDHARITLYGKFVWGDDMETYEHVLQFEPIRRWATRDLEPTLYDAETLEKEASVIEFLRRESTEPPMGEIYSSSAQDYIHTKTGWRLLGQYADWDVIEREV